MTDAVPIALAVGGTDSSGGAGLAADLITFGAHGVHGLLVVTAVTAQGPGGVRHRLDLPGESVTAQLEAAAELSPVIVKSGMLATADGASALSGFLARHPALRYVCDPVLAASSGEPLLCDEGIRVLREQLVPRSLVCTPNLAEAAALTGGSPADGARVLADKLLALGARWVVVTGGDQRSGADVHDLLVGTDGTRVLMKHERVETKYDRGTGCTFASALAARIAHGDSMHDAVGAATRFVRLGLRYSYPLSAGYGAPRRWPELAGEPTWRG